MRFKNLFDAPYESLHTSSGNALMFPLAISAAELNCSIGPVEKSFGKANWNVYACNDEHSLVIVSKPDSPAAPYYFIFHYAEGAYSLTGEGTGSPKFTEAAYAELKTLSPSEIVELRNEAVAD